MSTDLNPSGAAIEDRATHCWVSTILTRADKTAAVTQLEYLERELFDGSGHIRRTVTSARAEETVALINHLRHTLGWLEIGPDGRWRWPASVDAA